MFKTAAAVMLNSLTSSGLEAVIKVAKAPVYYPKRPIGISESSKKSLRYSRYIL